ncbi:hypothetical protein [Streptomyces sp. NPDC053427]|uniref:hypothetical protein n=1 Tax=Streptomyces sp. NPDC053427 TaxID=3365701 RepID=UPI0037CD4871
MDATELDAAYTDLLSEAEAIGDTTPLSADAQSAVDWTLAHLALSDRMLATAARGILSGLSVTIDNRDTLENTAIASLVASTTHAQRVDVVRRNAADLTTVIKAIPDHAAATPVQLHLVGRDGRPVPDQELPWDDLIRLRASEHLPGHTARLKALASSAQPSPRPNSRAAAADPEAGAHDEGHPPPGLHSRPRT